MCCVNRRAYTIYIIYTTQTVHAVSEITTAVFQSAAKCRKHFKLFLKVAILILKW